MTKSLDLGCGSSPKNPFGANEVFGVDISVVENASLNIRQADLAIDQIPFSDDEFDYVTAIDFVEHIPRVIYNPLRRNSFIELMNEVYRILKPSGVFMSQTPAFPHAAAFVDPTHVNYITEQTFPLYFADGNPTSPWAVIYGFRGAFKVVSQEWSGPHLRTVMQKVAVPEIYRDYPANMPRTA